MIKFLKYLMIWLGVLLVLACVAGYVYVRLEGKNFFEKKLTAFFDQPTTVEEVRYLVPFGVRFHQVNIKNVLEAEDVFLHLKIPFFLNKRFIIGKLELVSPVFHLVRVDQKEIDFGGAYLSKQEQRFQPKDNERQYRIDGVTIDFLSVSNGRVEILDLAVDEPLKYDVKGVNLKALKVPYPLKDQNVKFDIEGNIVNAGEEAWLEGSYFTAKGWINWPMRSMLSSAKLESALGLMGQAQLEGKDNVLKVKGDVFLASDGGEEVKGDDQVAKQVPALLGVIQGVGSELALNFNFETAMDSFTVDVLDFDGEIELPDEKKPLEKLNPTVLFGLGQESRSGN